MQSSHNRFDVQIKVIATDTTGKTDKKEVLSMTVDTFDSSEFACFCAGEVYGKAKKEE